MLYHFSENPDIAVFEPRPHPLFQEGVVWAIHERLAPLYWFPRECPRITFYKLPDSTPEDIERFMGHTEAKLVVAVENRWLDRIRDVKLYRYAMPAETFSCWEEGPGYYVSKETVVPAAVDPVGDLLERQLEAGVELRFTPSLKLLHEALPKASLHYSMIRMRNAVLE